MREQARSALGARSALDGWREVEALAGRLGVAPARLGTALAAARPAEPEVARTPDLAAALVHLLLVDARRVREILATSGPASRVAALAAGLGLDEATVRAAFAQLDGERCAEAAPRRAAVAVAVADELDLSAATVGTALARAAR